MERCKTCKRWVPTFDGSFQGRCLLIQRNPPGGILIELKLGFNEEVFTHQEFGCVQHEPKPAEAKK